MEVEQPGGANPYGAGEQSSYPEGTRNVDHFINNDLDDGNAAAVVPPPVVGGFWGWLSGQN